MTEPVWIVHQSVLAIQGLLKKSPSGVLDIFPCPRMGSTHCAQKWLRPSLRHRSGRDWTNPSTGSGHALLNRPEASDIQRVCRSLCPWDLLLFNTPIHDVLLAEFEGASGIRDESLLEPALARPLNLWSDEKPSLFRLAASYTHGRVKNYPFVEGNKDTGHVVGGIFLERNGQNLNASEEDATAAILALASNALTKDDFSHWLQDKSP